MIAVFRKEIRSYKISMTSYVFVAFLLAIIGVYFTIYNLNYAYPNIGYILKAVNFIFMIAVPMLTMRVLAEERRQKTDQLLLTIPLTVPEIVLGKFMALTAIYLIPVIVICLYPLVLTRFGTVDLTMAYIAIFGFFLMGCAMISIGLFFSSITESPVIAAMCSFGVLFVCQMSTSLSDMIAHTSIASAIAFAVLILILALIVYSILKNIAISAGVLVICEAVVWVLYFVKSSLLEGSFQKFLSVFEIGDHLDNFVNGILDIYGIVYFISIMVIFVFLTIQSVERRRFSSKNLTHGSYSILMTLIVIVVMVILNMIANKIPSQYKELDFSDTKLYTISGTTEEFLKNLNQDVTLYYICEGGKEVTTVQKLLDRYQDSSDHIKVFEKDPVVNPTFTKQYTSESVSNNSIIVVCGDRFKILNYSDLYERSMNYKTYSYELTSFDGEGQVTSAIDYVTTDQIPVLYVLNGNGEKTLSATAKSNLEKCNVEMKDLNLLTDGEIPEDATGIFIYAPSKDYTEDMADKIIEYLEAGGKALIFSDYSETEMPNFDRIIQNYGISRTDGIVLEADSNHYASELQYYLVPNIVTTEITSKLAVSNTFVLMPMSQGIQKLESTRASITITDLLTTSDNSYSKTDVVNMTTSDKEDGDVAGPFDLGVLIEEDINNDDKNETGIVYFSSSYLLDDDTDSAVSGGNTELVTSAVSYLCVQGESSISIPGKSVQVSYLTIKAMARNILAVFVIFFIPVLFIGAGALIWFDRRKK